MSIQRIELYPLRYPIEGFFKFFADPRGACGRAAIVIKIIDGQGASGWGQSVPIARWSDETPETAVVALAEYFVPALLGTDPEDIPAAHAKMDEAIAPGFSTGMPLTRAGIDIALWDLGARVQKKSLAELWGRPARASIPLSWTVNVRKLDEVAPLVAEGKRRGYRHFNIKVAPDPSFDAALAREVRSLAPDSFLWADANGGYTPESALDAALRLADAGVDVLESPLRPNRIRGYRALKRQGALPILMDEGVISAIELDEFLRLRMCDGVAMKPSRCGGLTSARAQIELLIERGKLWLGSGLTDPDIGLAASLALYGAYGLERPAALNGPQFLTADVLAAPLEIADGSAVVPQGPGLGIAVDEAKLRDLLQRSTGRTEPIVIER